MRLLHTSDWHLGHSLHGLSRAYEHERFFAWLLDLLEGEQVDALVVAGDVFDTANPSAEAQRMYYGLLRDALERCPGLDIVVVGGNHDSASRLDAPRELLAALGPRVVGGLSRSGEGAIDAERIFVELCGREGEAEALCVALPYLRPADLPSDVEVDEGEDELVVRMRALHGRVLDQAAERLAEGQALVVTGHCYMTGAVLSELSERKILGGHEHALPLDVFGSRPTYVALGHMHKAQRVGGREHVRYSGAPIALSFAEAGYAHQVRLIDFEAGALVAQRAVDVPRSVELVRIGPAPLNEVLVELDALPALAEAAAAEQRPYLEVRVKLAEPEPDLRAKVEAALEGKKPRLTRIAIETTGSGEALGAAQPERDLEELEPESVFGLLWQKQCEGEPPPEMLSAFRELVEGAYEAEP